LSSLKTALSYHPTTAKAALALTSLEAVGKLYQQLKTKVDQHLIYSITISENDTLYRDVHEWILEVLPEHRHRQLQVMANNYSGDGMMADSDPSGSSRLHIYFDDTNVQKTVIDGHQVKVCVVRADTGGETSRREPSKIRFETATQSGQRAVLRHIESLNVKRITRRPTLKIVGSWGEWETRADLPPRSMDSVIIPAEQKADILNDIGQFLDSEKFYVDRALPYHRGYMLHGPAGTGKTSLAKAIANHFNMDLWYIPLGDLKDETNLMSLISRVSPRSVLLLEDIDSVPGVRSRKETDNNENMKLTPAALLNALDGVATPHGLITIMTTNHFEWLDDALTRAGRMDRIELIDYPGTPEIAGLLKHFYGVDIHPCSVAGLHLSQAQVSEICKRNMHDVEGALAELQKLADQPWAATGQV
jgi:hypothetical protein